MSPRDIDWPHLAVLYGLCFLPWLLLKLAGINLNKTIAISLVRMSVQLGLVGFYLKTLFNLNNPWLNGLWILVMLFVADVSILQRAGLKVRFFALSTLSAIAFSTLLPTAYLVVWVIQPDDVFDAHYIVPLAGMMLGNCLQSNVIVLERFYDAVRKNNSEYLTFLLLGASRQEALRPYFVMAMTAAISPTLAGMASMGLVSLPGMMTGQILGGSDPWLAVKYQVAIMISLFATTTLACLSNLRLSIGIAFNDYDLLVQDVCQPQAFKR